MWAAKYATILRTTSGGSGGSGGGSRGGAWGSLAEYDEGRSEEDRRALGLLGANDAAVAAESGSDKSDDEGGGGGGGGNGNVGRGGINAGGGHGGESSGVDDENPDPRRLGVALVKLADGTIVTKHDLNLDGRSNAAFASATLPHMGDLSSSSPSFGSGAGGGASKGHRGNKDIRLGNTLFNSMKRCVL